MAPSGIHRSRTAPKPVLPAHVALRVSAYDQVSSGLIAMLVLVGALVLLLFMVWIGKKVTFTQVAVPVVPIIVEEEMGGFEHGKVGEDIELPGEVTGQLGMGGAAPEPSFFETMEMVTSVVASRNAELIDPKLSEETRWATGGVGGSRGTGNAPTLGAGGGSGGGVARPLRWLIEFEEGASLTDYAKQLDFFGVEIGVLGGGSQIQYAFNLAKPTPDKRVGAADKEERLYFSWRQGTLQQADRELLRRAGIAHSERLVVQFYPEKTENLLAAVEDSYLRRAQPGRDIKTVRQTRFRVKREGNGFIFVVDKQSYLGGG
jgi:hypothetical protein